MKPEKIVDQIIIRFFIIGILGIIIFSIFQVLISELGPTPADQKVRELSEKFQNLPTPSGTVLSPTIDRLNEAQRVLEITLDSWISGDSKETFNREHPDILYASRCRWECPQGYLQHYEILNSRITPSSELVYEFCVVITYSISSDPLSSLEIYDGQQKESREYHVREPKEDSTNFWSVIDIAPPSRDTESAAVTSEDNLTFCPYLLTKVGSSSPREESYQTYNPAPFYPERSLSYSDNTSIYNYNPYNEELSTRVDPISTPYLSPSKANIEPIEPITIESPILELPDMPVTRQESVNNLTYLVLTPYTSDHLLEQAQAIVPNASLKISNDGTNILFGVFNDFDSAVTFAEQLQQQGIDVQVVPEEP